MALAVSTPTQLPPIPDAGAHRQPDAAPAGRPRGAPRGGCRRALLAHLRSVPPLGPRARQMRGDHRSRRAPRPGPVLSLRLAPRGLPPPLRPRLNRRQRPPHPRRARRVRCPSRGHGAPVDASHGRCAMRGHGRVLSGRLRRRRRVPLHALGDAPSSGAPRGGRGRLGAPPPPLLVRLRRPGVDPRRPRGRVAPQPRRRGRAGRARRPGRQGRNPAIPVRGRRRRRVPEPRPRAGGARARPRERPRREERPRDAVRPRTLEALRRHGGLRAIRQRGAAPRARGAPAAADAVSGVADVGDRSEGLLGGGGEQLRAPAPDLGPRHEGGGLRGGPARFRGEPSPSWHRASRARKVRPASMPRRGGGRCSGAIRNKLAGTS